VAGALDGAGLAWTLRFVVDASPDGSLSVAQGLAAADPRLSVTSLPVNVGQNQALLAGLAAEERADAWLCLDADLQDPPEALPALARRLARGDVGVVFAGRRGAYEGGLRLATGMVHRAAMARLTGLPPDAGDDARGVERQQPVPGDPVHGQEGAGVGVARIRTASIPVARASRPSGRSAWTSPARLRQSGRTLAWAWRARA